jgi:hypothetical protein
LAADSRRCVLLIAAHSSRLITPAPAPTGANRQLSALIGGENQFSKDTLMILFTNDFVIGLPVSCFRWHHLISLSIS